MKRETRHRLLLAGIILVFIVLVVPAAGQIYHQDEYSWLTQMNGTDHSPDVHPPLYLYLGRAVGNVIGFAHIRWVAVPFALANILLVYAISRSLTGRKRVALVAAGLFAVNAYSVLAATMVDIDGALLPFFVLLAFLAYLRITEGKRRWYAMLVFAILFGFFAKLSFIICVGALVVDAGVRVLHRKRMSFSRLVRIAAPWAVGATLLAAFAYAVASHVLPGVVAYAEHFPIFDFRTRAYADLAFKLLKSSVLAGPLLLLGAAYALTDGSSVRRYRFWWLYLLFSALFYCVVFDFTTLTIERYFMFLIAPLALIAAEPIADMLVAIRDTARRASAMLQAAGFAALVGLTLFVGHDVLPLYPKAAFAQRVLTLRFNFLVPITGGSGPVGFYASALFIVLTFLLMFGALSLWRGRRSVFAACLFLGLGALFTAVMLEEYLVGGMYGSANRVAWETVKYVNENPAIHQVISYYNYGPYDLRVSGKYYSRFYVTPKRDYSAKIDAWHGHYMIVDFPAIASDDRYLQVIERCPVIKEFRDERIHSYVYDCTATP